MTSSRAVPPRPTAARGRNTALVVPTDRDRGGGPGQVALSSVFFVGLWIVLLFWWRASGEVPVKTTADRMNTVGRLCALIGTYLLLWQVLLVGRVPWLERAFGMDRLVWLHRWNAYLAVGLIAAHAVLQTIGYQLDNGFDTVRQLVDFTEHYEGVLPAIAGTGLLIAVTITSIAIVRGQLSYQTWFFVHLYSYLAVALAFIHQTATGADFINNGLFTVYWSGLTALVLGSLVLYRVVLPVSRSVHHRFHVQRVEREASGAISIYVAGRDLASFHFEPGQFAIWRFLDARRWWEAHPFSLSATPNDEYLRLTLKRKGDFSQHAASIRPGTPVLVEGPFGRFTKASATLPRALLIAGGIGITPIRALAEDLATAGADVCILYRCTHDEDVAFRKELTRLANDHGVRIEYLLSDRVLMGRPGGDWLLPNNLITLVPDVRQRDIYICGPVGLTKKVKRSLDQLGVGPLQIHTEAFQF